MQLQSVAGDLAATAGLRVRREGRARCGGLWRIRASSSEMAPGGPLTPAQCEQFEELGYTLVDTPMMADPSWLDEAEATWARKTGAQRSDPIDRGYVELIAHPFFEDVAKQMLRTDHVRTIEHGMHSRPPAQPGPQHAGAEAVAAHDAQREVSQARFSLPVTEAERCVCSMCRGSGTTGATSTGR